MRKRISVLLAVLLLLRVFCLTAAADAPYDVDGWTPSVGDEMHTSEQPFWVTQVDQAHRYAVDVEYQSMTIQVASAIWDVNEYHYHVTMDPKIENHSLKAFEFTVSVYNYSDLPIDVSVSTAIHSAYSGLLRVTQANADYTLDEVDMTPEPEKRVPSKNATQISLAPEQDWETFINTVIASGVPDDYIAPVGAVTLTISQN